MIKRFLIIVLFLVISGSTLASAYLDITGPTVIPRGGVGTINGTFSVDLLECPPLGRCSSLLPNNCYLGFVINPQNMTGAYGDRPPYFLNDTGFINRMQFDRSFGDQIIRPVVDKEARFYELVPNGETHPSRGEWVIPYDGTRYYTYLNAMNDFGWGGNIRIGTWYNSTVGVMGLKPGTYTIHAQYDVPAPSKSDAAEFTFTIEFGELDLKLYNYEDWTHDILTPVDSVIRGDKVLIMGKNTDSPTTYLWLSGKGLPMCGTGINPRTLPITDTQPTIINPDTVGNYGGSYFTNGEWYIIWDTTELPLQEGPYRLYAGSVNPDEVFPHLPPKGDAYTTSQGICAFDACPGCAPPLAEAPITLTEAEILDISITPSQVERECIPGYPCGLLNAPEEILLKGKAGASRLPMQIWLFGNNLMEEKGYIFDDSFVSSLDTQGSFEIELITEFFEKNDIDLCSLDPGTYYVVVQVPRVTEVGQETFDVTYEDSKFAKRINNALFPHDQDPERYYLVINQPYYWSKVVPLIGPDSAFGYLAYNKLIETLNTPGVRDRYAIGQFTIRDKEGYGTGIADFTGTPNQGYVPLQVQFNDTSTYSGSEWYWTFGDNSVSTEKNPVHVYADPGNYDVYLTVKNQSVSKFAIKYDYINAKTIEPQYFTPIADYTFAKVDNEPQAIQFIDQSYGASPLTYNWSFGNNAYSNQKNPKHTFSEVGTYLVNLSVTDQFSKSSIISKQIIVPPVTPPVAAFNYTFNPNNPLQVTFFDESRGEPYSWKWTFGDGDETSIQSPVHLFSPPEYYPTTYRVTLTVGNSAGSDMIYKDLVMESPVLVPDFTWQASGDRSVIFADASEGPIQTYFLDFGDGTSESFSVEGWQTEHRYVQRGIYPVILTTANSFFTESKLQWVTVTA